MTSSFFNPLDYFYISLVLISCLVGIFRGFVKDFFSTCSWLGSGFITTFTFPYFAEYIQKNEIILDPTYAQIVAGIFSFSVIWITLRMIINIVSHTVKSSMLSDLDRAFGALYGFVRGFVILITICIFAIMFDMLDMKRESIANSKITPILIDVTDYLLPHIIIAQKSDRKFPLYQSNKNILFPGNSVQQAKHLSKGQIHKSIKISQKQTEESKSYLTDLISKFFDKENTSTETSQSHQSRNPTKIKNKEYNVQFSEVDLIKARAKRKAQKKAERIRRDLMKSLDNKP